MLIFILLPAPVLASVVQDLYSASVPVDSQSSAERAKALRAALAQVVVKVTGNRKASGDSAVSDILAHPRKYLQAYRYKRHQPSQGEPLFGANAASNLDFWARFDRRALNRALRSAGAPVWGRVRPATIVWLAFAPEEGQRRIITSDSDGKVLPRIEKAAKKRGLPLLFPLMDVKDRARVHFTDVSGGFTAPVVKASERYQPDAVLMGRLDAGADGSSAHWTLAMNGQTSSWSDRAKKPAALAADAIQHLADLYASKFVAAGGNGASGGALRIIVSGVDSLGAYGQVLKYLRSLSALTAVEPAKVAGDTITFDAHARATVADVKQTIGLGAMLETADSKRFKLPAAASRATPAALHYQYQ